MEYLLTWLETTRLAMFIHQKPWAFTSIRVVHVLAISAVIGTIAVVDLRLLGRGATMHRVTELTRAVLPWTWAAFGIAALAGSLLFLSQATAYFMNATFWIKMSLMVLAAINMLIFELVTVRGVEAWDFGRSPPVAARLAGAISLACWVLVFAFGRWTGFTVMPT